MFSWNQCSSSTFCSSFSDYAAGLSFFLPGDYQVGAAVQMASELLTLPVNHHLKCLSTVFWVDTTLWGAVSTVETITCSSSFENVFGYSVGNFGFDGYVVSGDSNLFIRAKENLTPLSLPTYPIKFQLSSNKLHFFHYFNLCLTRGRTTQAKIITNLTPPINRNGWHLISRHGGVVYEKGCSHATTTLED